MTRRDRMRATLREIKDELRSGNPRARGLDRAGRQRLLRLPRSANQRSCAESILLLCIVERIWLRTLRRRSQEDRFSWQRMHRLAADWIPKPRILHPYPDKRFAVTHPRWSRVRESRPHGSVRGRSVMTVPTALRFEVYAFRHSASCMPARCPGGQRCQLEGSKASCCHLLQIWS
jgi:hypothetical protein